MTTYSLIIKKTLNINNNLFFKQDHKDNIDPIIRLVFWLNTINNTKKPLYRAKFENLIVCLESFLIKDQKEEEVLDYFCKIQRTYHTLNRFVFRYKYKKSKIVVNTDMTLNELHESDKNVICIYQENSRYLFKIFDILKIINMSLIHSQNFFAMPIPIKNPYNNVPFSKSILYSIYNYLVSNKTILYRIDDTELFLKFHRCHFRLTKFINKYEYLLREKTIINTTINSMTNALHLDIKNMLELFNNNKLSKNRIFIDDKFPKEKLVTTFMPYLILYINSKHLLVPTLKFKASCELEEKLINFQKENPLFGRVKIIYKNIISKQGSIYRVKVKETYNDKCTHFDKYDNDAFLEDHLSYTYNSFAHSSIFNNEFEEEEEEEEQYLIDNNSDYDDNITIVESSDSESDSESDLDSVS